MGSYFWPGSTIWLAGKSTFWVYIFHSVNRKTFLGTKF